MKHAHQRPYRVAEQHNPAFFASVASLSPGSTGRGCFTQWVMSLTLEGECRLWLEGKEKRAAKGTLLLMRPGTDLRQQVPEQGRAAWRVAYSVFHPRPHWLAWLQLPGMEAGYALMSLHDTPASHKVRRLMLACCRQYAGGALERDALGMLALERLLLVLREYRREQESDPRVHSAVELMNADYARDWTVEQLARACHASPSHLSYLFQRTTGLAPIQYLEQVRLQRAMEMLALGPASIEEIAHRVGYRYASYFARRFRRHTGQSPWEYRQQVREM